MILFRSAILFILSLYPAISFSQSTEEVEMADVLRQDGKIYTVVIALVIILTAMIILLVRLDRKVHKLERESKKE